MRRSCDLDPLFDRDLDRLRSSTAWLDGFAIEARLEGASPCRRVAVFALQPVEPLQDAVEVRRLRAGEEGPRQQGEAAQIY